MYAEGVNNIVGIRKYKNIGIRVDSRCGFSAVPFVSFVCSYEEAKTKLLINGEKASINS